MAVAASSLPTPLSPCSSTDASEFAASAIFLNTFCIAGVRPSIPSSVFARRSCRSRGSTRSARSIAARISATSNGFTTYSNAPLLIASTAVARSPNAVMTMIGAPLSACRTLPSPSGRPFPAAAHRESTHPAEPPTPAQALPPPTAPHRPRGPCSAPIATGPTRSTARHQQLEFWTLAHPFIVKGSPTRNRVIPFSLFHSIDPPWAATTSFATASPKPAPSALSVTNGSNNDAATDSAGPAPESLITISAASSAVVPTSRTRDSAPAARGHAVAPLPPR